MPKKFNVTGLCLPEKHYMADTSGILKQIVKMIDEGNYFTINRARQYGKTTLLELLRRILQKRYVVLSLSFEGMGTSSFANEDTFTREFLEYGIIPELEMQQDTRQMIEICRGCLNLRTEISLARLSHVLLKMCSIAGRPVVMMIDEVDSAANHQVFFDFLAVLRSQYLKRSRAAAFHCVVLAGVYDIKNLKLKIREDKEHKYNSPWNIAAQFPVDLHLSRDAIKYMLAEYEEDYHTGMDINEMSRIIYEYTSGYPYLVSNYCKLLDEQVSGTAGFPGKSDAWTKSGFLYANQILLNEKSSLFDDMIKKLEDFPELKDTIARMLFCGDKCSYNPDDFSVNIGIMFGFLKKENEYAVIANRVFETRIYNWLLTEEREAPIYKAGEQEKNSLTAHGFLQMQLVIEGFYRHFTSIFNGNDEAFIEAQGRKIFLMYLRPILNGSGNYYVEAQTRDNRRTDIIVDYHGRRDIIELKIWRGNEYHRKGEKQLCDYLDDYGLDVGYLVSFNFNKGKKTGIHEEYYEGKKIIEVVV